MLSTPQNADATRALEAAINNVCIRIMDNEQNEAHSRDKESAALGMGLKRRAIANVADPRSAQLSLVECNGS